jgi:hypothetical protein
MSISVFRDNSSFLRFKKLGEILAEKEKRTPPEV